MVLCLLIAVALFMLTVATKKKIKPNVVLIVVDTLRADHLSTYGYHRNTSPHIDMIAKTALVFEKHFSTSCWTLPSHASLFTGLFPLDAGATSETLLLPFSKTTVAEVFQKNGYQTSGFVCNSWLTKDRGFAQGFSQYSQIWLPENHQGVKKDHQMLENAAVSQMLSWLDNYKKEAPFFMFSNLNGVHLPYRPPALHQEKFLSKTVSQTQIDFCKSLTSCWSSMAGETKISAEDYDVLNALYDAEINYLDEQIGALFAKLKEKELLKNTIFIITSDHGENIGEHDRIDHMMSMYDTTLHIPLIVHMPDGIGKRVPSLVSMIDVAPSILSACGIADDDFSPEIQLFSSNPNYRKFILAGNERPLTAVKLLESRYPAFDAQSINFKIRAIRTLPDKFVLNEGAENELYDLKTDPMEMHNIHHQHQKKEKQYTNILNELWRIDGNVVGKPYFKSKDKVSMDKLKALGYVD